MFIRPAAAAVYIENNLEYACRKYDNTSTAAVDWKSVINRERSGFEGSPSWFPQTSFGWNASLIFLDEVKTNNLRPTWGTAFPAERRSAGCRQQRNRITRKWSRIDHEHSVRLAALRQADLSNLPLRACSMRSGRLNAACGRDRESFTFDYLLFFFERGGFGMEFSILSVKFVPYFSEVFSRKSCCETNVTLQSGSKWAFIFSRGLTFSLESKLLGYL